MYTYTVSGRRRTSSAARREVPPKMIRGSWGTSAANSRPVVVVGWGGVGGFVGVGVGVGVGGGGDYSGGGVC